MLDLLGTNDRIQSNELAFTKALLSRNRCIYNVGSADSVNLISMPPCDLKSSYLDYDLFNDLKGGIVIPVDFLDEKAIFPEKVVLENKNKFIRRPDFLYLDTSSSEVNVYPVDFKQGSVSSLNSPQVSSLNLLYLTSISKYVDSALRYVSKTENKDVVLNGGYFISKKFRSSSSLNTLETYILNYLNEKNLQGGFGIDSEKGVYFDPNQQSLFNASSEVSVQKLTASSYKREMKSIRKKLKKSGFYPNSVFVIDAVNEGGMSLGYQYNLTGRSKTNPTKLNERERELEFISNYPVRNFDKETYVGLCDLYVKDLSKRIFSLTCSHNINEVELEELIDLMGDSDTKANVKKHSELKDNYDVLTKKIESKERLISSISENLNRQRSEIYSLCKSDLYLPDGFKKINEIKSRLKTNLNEEIEVLRTNHKYKRRMDATANRRLGMIQKNSDFKVDEEFLFSSSPCEIYFHLLDDEVLKVTTFNLKVLV